jgi:benzoate/toluate 1,2-dioxygenase alpha subunit
VSLAANVAPIEDFLGATKAWIDLMVDQSPDGLEVVPGAPSYMIGGNWKMQAENGVDGYHVSTVHRVFATTMSARQSRDNRQGMAQTEAGRIVGNVPTASYDLGNGHMAIWATHTTPEVRPIWEARERLKATLPEGKVDWILNKGRNLMLFPNVLLMDNPSTQIRVMKPIAPDRTEVVVYCVAPKGESKAARSARLRKFEDFYLTAGMATSDDISALEDTYAGSLARYTPWSEMVRGWDATVKGPDAEARKLGFEPVTSNPNWDHEILFHGFYRQWAKLIGNSNGKR